MTDRTNASDILATRFDGLASQFSNQLRNGELPDIETYVRNNRDLEERIRKLFPILEMMESDGSSPDNWSNVESIENLLSDYVESPPSKELGDFRIIREIGRGGMGIVFLAEQKSLGRQVALKLLPESANFDVRRRKRFQQEARASAMLHHTNIVQVFDIGQHKGQSYLVMQLIDGSPLSEFLIEMESGELPNASTPSEVFRVASTTVKTKVAGAMEDTDRSHVDEFEKQASGRMRTDAMLNSCDAESQGLSQQTTARNLESGYFLTVAEMGIQVSEALAHAHAKGVLHRDIKPSNLLIDEAAQVWVTDFGLAKTLESPDLTATGEVVGTLRYMSPEQLKGTFDERSDIFALGLTLYELLTLKPAYHSNDREALITEAMEASPRKIRAINPAVPLDLATIVQKCIRRDARYRYQTANELCDDLTRFCNDQPIAARPPGTIEKSIRWCKRNPVVSCLTAGLIMSLIAGIAGVTFQWQETKAALQKSIDSNRVAEEQSLLALETLDDVIYEFSQLIESSQRIPELGKAKTNLSRIAINGLKHVSDNLRQHSQYHQTLIWAHVDIGDVLINVGKGDFEDCRPEAMKEYLRAYELVNGWLEADPDNWRAQKIRPEVLEKLGHGSFLSGNLEDAVDYLSRGAKECREVLEQAPDNEMTLYRLVRILRMQGIVEFRRFQLDKALPILKLARQEIETMKTMCPGSEEGAINDYYIPTLERTIFVVENLPIVRADISNAYKFDKEVVPFLLYDTAAWLAYDGEHVGAAKVLAEMADYEFLRSTDHFQVACGYCRCIKALLDNTTIDDLSKDDLKQYQTYLKEAIEQLEFAKENGFFNTQRISWLANDADLDAIRDTGAFKDYLNTFKQ